MACGRTTNFERGDKEAIAALEAAIEANLSTAAFQGLIDRYPLSFEVRKEYARRSASGGHSAVAIEALEQLLRFDPKDQKVMRRLATLFLFVGQLERAQKPIDSLLADDPSAGDLLLAARLAHARGDLAKAQLAAQKALEKNPSSSAAHQELALILLEAEAPDETRVRTELEAALALDPGLSEAHFALGTLQLQGGAESAGKQSLKKGRVVQELTSPAFAKLLPVERIQRAYQIGAQLPRWSRPILEIARAELERKRPKKAEASLKRAAKLLPDTAERHKLLFATAKAMGNQALAQKRLRAWKRMRDQTP